MNFQTRNSLLYAGLTLLLLTNASCMTAASESFPHDAHAGSAPAPQTETPNSLWEAPRVQPSPSPSIEPDAPHGCGWQWNEQSQPELSTQFLEDLEQRGLQPQSAQVYAYGEDCLDPLTLEVLYFAAMETDFRISLRVSSVEDRDELGRQLHILLQILQAYPPESTPGPQPGRVDVTFLDGSAQTSLHFKLLESLEAAKPDLTNTALFERLSGQP